MGFSITGYLTEPPRAGQSNNPFTASPNCFVNQSVLTDPASGAPIIFMVKGPNNINNFPVQGSATVYTYVNGSPFDASAILSNIGPTSQIVFLTQYGVTYSIKSFSTTTNSFTLTVPYTGAPPPNPSPYLAPVPADMVPTVAYCPALGVEVEAYNAAYPSDESLPRDDYMVLVTSELAPGAGTALTGFSVVGIDAGPGTPAPIEVLTGSLHNLSTGQTLILAGFVGAPINGVFLITVTGPQKFVLNGTTWSSAYDITDFGSISLIQGVPGLLINAGFGWSKNEVVQWFDYNAQTGRFMPMPGAPVTSVGTLSASSGNVQLTVTPPAQALSLEVSNVAVSSVGNLIEVTTRVPHGRSTGEAVIISGVIGVHGTNSITTPALIPNTITKVNATSFTLDTSSFPVGGQYVGGGTVLPIAAYSLPFRLSAGTGLGQPITPTHVVLNDSFFTSGGPASGVELALSSGDLNWSLVALATYDGENIQWQQQGPFALGTSNNIGTLSSAVGVPPILMNPIPGVCISGDSANVTSVGAVVTLTRLAGMTPACVGQWLVITGATNAANKGSYQITTYISPTAITISNPNAVVESGHITWTLPQTPLLRIGYLTWLQAVPVPTSADFNSVLAPPLVPGTIQWAMDSGALNFYSTDLTDNSGVGVYYDGVLWARDFWLPRLAVGPINAPMATVNLPIPATGDLIFYISYDPTVEPPATPFPFYQFPYYSIITVPDTSGGSQGTVEISQNNGALTFSASDVNRYGSANVTLVYGDVVIDHGVSMRFFRCPVNLTGQMTTVKDVTAFYTVDNAVWASPIIASPVVFIPAVPIDDDTLVLNVAQGTGTFTGVLNRVDIPNPQPGVGYIINFDSKQITFGTYQADVLIPLVEPSGYVNLPNPLVLSTNFSMSLETGLNTNVFIPQVMGEDYLLDSNAGVVTFITTLGIELAIGSIGTFSGSPLTMFTDNTANFKASVAPLPVQVGDFLLITNGIAEGVYTVTAVDPGGHILTTDVPAPPQSVGPFAYQIMRGIEILADRFFQSVTLTDPTTSVERITGLGTIQNATTLVPTSTATFTNLTTMRDDTSPVVDYMTLGVQQGDTITFTPENGTAASVSSVVGSTATITGLTLLGSDASVAIVGQKIVFSDAAASGNNGTFSILSYISPSSVTISSKTLSGTFYVTNGSPAVQTKISQVGTLSPGDMVVFAFQPDTVYTVSNVSATSISLSASYMGVTNTQTTAYTPHDASDAHNGGLHWTLVQNTGTRLVQVVTAHTLTPTVSFASVDTSTYTVTRRLRIPISYIGVVRFRFGLPPSGGTGVFSSAVNVVAQDTNFTAPGSLAQGVVEVSRATGNLNFSSADTHAGGAVYVSRRLALNTDYQVQPVLGFIKFMTRLLTNEEVLLTYVQAPPVTSPPTPAVTFSNERGTFLVRKELVQPHPTPTATLKFNPTGKAVATNPAAKVWRGGRPQEIPRLASVNPATSTITFNQDAQLQTALPSGTPIAPIENVYIDYYVYQAMGGELSLTVLNSPLQVATVNISDGLGSTLIASDQRPNFPTDFLMLVNNTEVYKLGAATYDSVANVTTVNLAGSQVFQSDQVNPPLQVASGATPTAATPSTPSYFVAELNPYINVPRGMNQLVIPGNRTQAYQTNTIVYVTDIAGSFTDFYLVTSSKYTPATYTQGSQTTVLFATNALRQYTFGTHIISYSVRPVFGTAPTNLATVNPPVTTQPSTIIRRVGGQVGQILSTPTDYTFDATGAVTYVTALNPNEEFAIFYTGNIFQPAGPRVSVSFAYSVAPDTTTNGLLGQTLNANSTLFSPDNFYYRVETLTNFKGQVAQALTQAAQSGSPSGGPMTSNSSSPTLYTQGCPGLWFPEGDYANQDIVARASLKYFNDAINYLEDFLHAVDGRIVGDIDGRFLFDGVLGRYDYFSYNPVLLANYPTFFPPPYPLQELISNQIDDYVQTVGFPWPPPNYPDYLSYFQQAYTNGLNSRFFPSQRLVRTQNPSNVSSNPNFGDVVATFNYQNLSWMPQRMYKRVPRAQTQFDYPYGTTTFVVNNVVGDGTLLPPWWDPSTSEGNAHAIPPLNPSTPSQILGMLVVIQDPNGNFYLDENDNARVVSVTLNPPSIVISSPVHQPAGTGGSPPSPSPVSGLTAAVNANWTGLVSDLTVQADNPDVTTATDLTSTLSPGDVLLFAPDTHYYTVDAITSTQITLTSPYLGSTTTTTARPPPGVVLVSGLSGNFPSSGTGVLALSMASSGGNTGSFNVVPNSLITTPATFGTPATNALAISQNLLGTFSVTPGSSIAVPTADLSSILVPDVSVIVFNTTPTAYKVVGVTQTQVTLSPHYGGSSLATTATAFALNIQGSFNLPTPVSAGTTIVAATADTTLPPAGSSIIFMTEPTKTYTVASVVAIPNPGITLTTDYTGSASTTAYAYMPFVTPDGSNGSINWVLPQTFKGIPGMIPAGSTIYTSPYDNCAQEWSSYGVDGTGATGTYGFNYKIGWDVNLNTQDATVLYQDVWWPFNGNSLIKFPTFIIPESDYITAICNGDILEIPGAGVGVNYTPPYEFPALTGQQLDDDGNITIPIVGPTFDGEMTSGGGGPLNFESVTECPPPAAPEAGVALFRTSTTTAPLVATGQLTPLGTRITLNGWAQTNFPTLPGPAQSQDPRTFNYQSGLGPKPKQYDLVQITSGSVSQTNPGWRRIQTVGDNYIEIDPQDAWDADSSLLTFAVALSATSDPNSVNWIPNLGSATVSGKTFVDTSAITSGTGPFLSGPVIILANTYGQLGVTANSYGTSLIDNIVPVQPLTVSDPNWGSLMQGYGVVTIGDVVTGSGLSNPAAILKIGPGSSVTVDTTMTGGNQSGSAFAIQLGQPPPTGALPLPGTFDTTAAGSAPFHVTSSQDLSLFLLAGSPLYFGKQPNTSYTVDSVTSTTVTLTEAYTGTVSSEDIATSPPLYKGTVNVLNHALPSAAKTVGGSAAAIVSTSNGIATLTDTGFSSADPSGFSSLFVGCQITISGASAAVNNGSFMIVGFTVGQPAAAPAILPSLQISNPLASGNDYGSGTSTGPKISWTLQPVPTITGLTLSFPTTLPANVGLSLGDNITSGGSYFPNAKITQIGPGPTSLTIDQTPTAVITESGDTLTITKAVTLPLPTPWSTTVDSINPFPLFTPPATQSNALGFTPESYVSGGGIPYTPKNILTYIKTQPAPPYTSFVLVTPPTESVVQGVITVFVQPTVQAGWTLVVMDGENEGLRRQIDAVVSTYELTLDSPFPQDDTGFTYRIDNPLNTYNGPTLTALQAACTASLDTLYQKDKNGHTGGLLDPLPVPYVPNILNEQQALVAFFDTVFTTVISSTHGTISSSDLTTLEDLTVDFIAAGVNTSYLVYVHYDPPASSGAPYPITPITASTETLVGPLFPSTITPTIVSTGLVDMTSSILPGDSLVFLSDTETPTKAYQVNPAPGSVVAPVGSTPGYVTLTSPGYTGVPSFTYPGTGTQALNLNVLTTSDTASCGVSNIVTGPGLPTLPPTVIVSISPGSIRLSASATTTGAQQGASYTVTATSDQFANMGVYGIGTVTDYTHLQLTFMTPSTGFSVPCAGLKYEVVTQFGTSLTTLQGIFSILEANAAFMISTYTFFNLITSTVPVYSNALPDGTPDVAEYANGINDLVDDLSNRYSVVNSTSGRLSYLSPSNPAGPVSIVESALNTTDQLYNYRYVWINARINLQSGYLTLKNTSILTRVATQAKILNNLMQLLTVQGS